MVGNQLRILPPEIGQLTNLRVLAADSNQLTILPGEGGRAREAVWLDGSLDKKRLQPQLVAGVRTRDRPHSSAPCLLRIAGELRRCEQLEELTLQHNRLTSVLLSFASLRHLRCACAACRRWLKCAVLSATKPRRY